jgi:glutaredoxin 3
VPKIEIYSKTTCPYCIRAKRLLDAKGLTYEEHVIDFGGEDRQEMIQRSGGRTTVPQIFIGGRHIGGCDDLLALQAMGKLNALLAA